MKTDLVNVKVKSSLPQIDLMVDRIGPLVAGTEVSLERWQAEILRDFGKVEGPKDSNTLLSEAFALRDREQRSRTLENVADIFHVFPEILSVLSKEGMLTQKKAAVRSLFEDVVSSRTNKVTRMARMAQDPGDALSPEEMWLYWSLRRVFDAWRHDTGLLIEQEENGRG